MALQINTTKRLKIGTMICHAFILCGVGHGVLFIGLIEIFTFPYFTLPPFKMVHESPGEGYFSIVGLTALLGQIFILVSIYYKGASIKLVFQLLGMALLWTGLLYFGRIAYLDDYVDLPYLTCVPFAVCTIITFAGNTIKKLTQKSME